MLDLGVGAHPETVLAVLRQAPSGLGEPMRTGSAVSVPSSLPVPDLTDLASRLDLTAAGATTISIRPARNRDHDQHRQADGQPGHPGEYARLPLSGGQASTPRDRRHD